MDPSVQKPWSLWRTPEGPLVEHLDAFARWLSDQGYAAVSIHPQIRLVADFSQWLKHRRIAASELTPQLIKCYLRHRAHHLRPTRSDAATLRRFLELLHQKAVLAPRDTATMTACERMIDAYVHYLREERVLAPATLHNYVRVARRFLTGRFGRGPVELARLSGADVIGFVGREARRICPKSGKFITTGLRAFLRYARYRGDVSIDLAAAVPAVAAWSMASIPRAISAAHAEAVLAACDRRTPVGRRDYAILLLLARLGLRSGNVPLRVIDQMCCSTFDLLAGRHAA